MTSTEIQLKQGTPSFTVAAPYKSFGLYDFYFGCAVRTGEPTANAAVQCTISVSGFVPKTNQQVAVASYTFTPPTLKPPIDPVEQVPMFHAILPDKFHQGLNNVTVVADNKLAVLLVDNLVSLPEHPLPFHKPSPTLQICCGRDLLSIHVFRHDIHPRVIVLTLIAQ